jgi:isopentenyl-diphosphate delta-isomerase
MSQKELMAKDECVLVNENDEIVGTASKFDAHRFTPGSNPKGLLHRAFSVLLFNEKNELLLQQRASHKITFPDVWTNTCCSHPLSGFTPDEVDDKESVDSGNVDGIKAAAQRKLAHELGINVLPTESIRYISRIHYSAPCSILDGDKDVDDGNADGGYWGESEIDYILLTKLDTTNDTGLFSMQPNAEEVRGVRFVSQDELVTMMADPGLKWSPWFRLLAEKLLPAWWNDLDRAITTSDYVELEKIHRFQIEEEMDM